MPCNCIVAHSARLLVSVRFAGCSDLYDCTCAVNPAGSAAVLPVLHTILRTACASSRHSRHSLLFSGLLPYSTVLLPLDAPDDDDGGCSLTVGSSTARSRSLTSVRAALGDAG